MWGSAEARFVSVTEIRWGTAGGASEKTWYRYEDPNRAKYQTEKLKQVLAVAGKPQLTEGMEE